MAKNSSQKGFTLVELMVVVAIIGLLSAMAIPQFLTFGYKAKRAEAIVLLNGGYKAQLAYYADVNHFMTAGADSVAPVNTLTATQRQTLNDNLGLPYVVAAFNNSKTPTLGWNYGWDMSSYLSFGKPQAFEMYLSLYLNPQNTSYSDQLYIGQNGYTSLLSNCVLCGWQNGKPYQYYDSLKYLYNCPC